MQHQPLAHLLVEASTQHLALAGAAVRLGRPRMPLVPHRLAACLAELKQVVVSLASRAAPVCLVEVARQVVACLAILAVHLAVRLVTKCWLPHGLAPCKFSAVFHWPVTSALLPIHA